MKHRGRNIALLAIIVVIITFVVLWITGPIPSLIARASAQSYVSSRYASKDLKFSDVYWDSMWQRYFVSFTDETGSIYNFKMSEFFPNTIMYDPINPPG